MTMIIELPYSKTRATVEARDCSLDALPRRAGVVVGNMATRYVEAGRIRKSNATHLNTLSLDFAKLETA